MIEPQQRCPTVLDLNLVAGNTVFNVMPGPEMSRIILKGLQKEGLELPSGNTPEEQLQPYVQRLLIYVRTHIRSCVQCDRILKEKIDGYQRDLDKETSGF